jgi:hypothetical protein
MKQFQRGQVFVLATLMIVVFSVSIISVVTELSINRTKTDEIELDKLVTEFQSEMKYQLELQLYNYVKYPSITTNDIVSNLESFKTDFSLYANSKGVDASINLRLNEFILSATKNNVAPSALGVGGTYNKTIYLSINSSILFQSSNSGSKISGIFIHYFGINGYISPTDRTILTFTEKDFFGNVLNFISGITFASPGGVTDNLNGDYQRITFDSQTIYATLPSGLEFLS